MNDSKGWKPTNAALEKLVRDAIRAAGPGVRPEELPHIVRARLAGAATGEKDLDTLVRHVLADMKKRGEA